MKSSAGKKGTSLVQPGSDQLKKYAEATLGSGNLKLAVALPEGEDVNEWLAVNSMSARKIY